MTTSTFSGAGPPKGKTKKHQKRTNDLELAASIWPQRIEPNPETLRTRGYPATRASNSAVCFAKSEKEPKLRDPPKIT